MSTTRVLRLAVLAAWLVSNGCMTLREVPRAQLGAHAERNRVRVETREGLHYEFDYATFAADTLTGYRSRPDVEGPVDQVASFKIPFDQLQTVETRQLDWRRTGLVGGTLVAAVIAAGLGAAHHDTPATSGGGTTPPFNP